MTCAFLFSLRRYLIYTQVKNSKTLTSGRQQVCKHRPTGAWTQHAQVSGLENGRGTDAPRGRRKGTHKYLNVNVSLRLYPNPIHDLNLALTLILTRTDAMHQLPIQTLLPSLLFHSVYAPGTTYANSTKFST